MMYYDQFNTGKRIQKLRRERYLTQEELAVRLNVSDRHLRSLCLLYTSPSPRDS